MPNTENTERDRLQAEMHREIWSRIRKKEGQKRFRRNLVAVVGMFCLLLIGVTTWNKKDVLRKKQAIENTIVYSVDTHNALIVLPDSSSVLLEKGSKISYRADFNLQQVRHVKLDGRAYFDIKKNPKVPFIVEYKDIDVQVLGTAFDIDTRCQKEFKLTVNEGSVRVAHQKHAIQTLKPKDQLKFNFAQNKYRTKIQDDLRYMNWQYKDDLVFDNVTVQDACRLFARKFGFDFEFQDPLIGKTKFTTLFKSDESLESILNSISSFTNSHFVIDKFRNKIILKS